MSDNRKADAALNDLIIGRNPVLEAIRSGREIDKILIKKGSVDASLGAVLKKAKERGIVIRETEKQKMDKLSEGGSHQGIIAYAASHEYTPLEELMSRSEKGKRMLVICDRITDPHNLGSILRSADCVGADGVIIPKHESAGLNSVVAKTSAGALEYIPVAKVANISQTIAKLKDNGFWIAGADMDGSPMYECSMTGDIALVIGSEGTGISRIVKENCDFLVKIPMRGHIDSLNASVAAAVLMYEAFRQRNQ